MKVAKSSSSSSCKRNVVEFIVIHFIGYISPYIRRIFDVIPYIRCFKISILLHLFSLSNKWTYPNLNVYLFVIERQFGLGKKYQFMVLRKKGKKRKKKR